MGLRPDTSIALKAACAPLGSTVSRHKIPGCGVRLVLGFVAQLAACTSGSEPPKPLEQISTAPVEKVELPTTEANCVAAGGEWILLGPQMTTHGCMLKAKDGGKACTTSAECQSECVEYRDGNRCADYVDGCFEPTGRGTSTQCVN